MYEKKEEDDIREQCWRLKSDSQEVISIPYTLSNREEGQDCPKFHSRECPS